jgi:hypothetical protein
MTRRELLSAAAVGAAAGDAEAKARGARIVGESHGPRGEAGPHRAAGAHPHLVAGGVCTSQRQAARGIGAKGADDPAAWIEPVAGRPLEYRTKGQAKDVTLVPLHRLFDERYAVYWKVSQG